MALFRTEKSQQWVPGDGVGICPHLLTQESLAELGIKAGLGECQHSAVSPSPRLILALTRSYFSSS